MKILNGSIDLSKIDKSKIVTKDKNGQPFKNGGKYLNVTLFISDEKDQYGNDASIIISQTKEEQERKDKRTYFGNFKTSYDSAGSNNNEQHTDDLPF